MDSIKETHEANAINLVKTKLNGAVRNTISSETTLQEIIVKLMKSIRGETVELMNIRQQNKNANTYTSEIEDLAK